MKELIYIFVCLSLSSCQDFAIKEKIIGNYYLTAPDEGEQCELSYKEDDNSIYGGIVGSTVFAVGYNSSYMIIKQHPRIFPYPRNKNVTYFFILPLKQEMNFRTNNGLMGPLTLEQFNQKRKELNIPDSVTFTKVIKDLE